MYLLECVVQNRRAEVCNGNVHNSAHLFLKRKGLASNHNLTLTFKLRHKNVRRWKEC